MCHTQSKVARENILVSRYCNNHVAPTELEDILQTHPAVAESLVFGIKEPSVQGGNSIAFLQALFEAFFSPFFIIVSFFLP